MSVEAQEQHRKGKGGSVMTSKEHSIEMSKENIRERKEREAFKNKYATLRCPLLDREQGKITKKGHDSYHLVNP